MIVTDRFVFLHLHKSGGSFVNECLLCFMPDAHEIGYHLPGRLIPAAASPLPVLGFVRSPWSYYVSWYAFQASRAQPNAIYRRLSEDGSLDFKGTVRNMLELGTSTHLDRLLRELPQQYGNRGLNLPAAGLAPIRGSGMGFYSFLYQYMFGEVAARLRVGRMEALRTELPAMLAETGYRASAQMLEFIATATPRNVTQHARYVDHYDTELRQLVAERDAAVIERHHYRFGD